MPSGTYNIAVGVDFSDSSAGAMYHALALAERLGATLHLVHIAPYHANLSAPTDLGLNIPPEFEEAQQARERLERMRVMLGSQTAVELHLRMGDAVTAFLEVIRDIKPDMVVVGSHGRGAVMRLLLGSVSTQLAQRSPVPVLVVPAPGREMQTHGDPPPPAVDSPPAAMDSGGDALDVNRTNDSNSGSVNVAPGGTSGYDVNPELRVRY